MELIVLRWSEEAIGSRRTATDCERKIRGGNAEHSNSSQAEKFKTKNEKILSK